MRVVPSLYVDGASHASILGVDVPEPFETTSPVPEPVVSELDVIYAAFPPPAPHPEIVIARIVKNTTKGMAPMRDLLHISASVSGSKKMSFMEPISDHNFSDFKRIK
jgi:hypothetical protein